MTKANWNPNDSLDRGDFGVVDWYDQPQWLGSNK